MVIGQKQPKPLTALIGERALAVVVATVAPRTVGKPTN